MSVSSLPEAFPSAGSTNQSRASEAALSLAADPARFWGASAERVAVETDFDPRLLALTKRDFAYTSAMVEAAERMQGQLNLVDLYSAIAAEAGTLVGADQAAVIRFEGIRRLLAGVHLEPWIDDERVSQGLVALATEQLLITPGTTDDLHLNLSWVDAPARPVDVQWRSILVLPVASPHPADQSRIVWLSSVPGHFEGRAVVAALFARHASVAVRAMVAPNRAWR
jgi:hypothetical protein